MSRRVAVFVCALLLVTAPQAATFRWASINDHSSADPHAQNQIVNNSINGQVYEPLVKRGKKLEIIPALAESWTQVSPTVWRFNLRRGVKWQDGSAFTADDVVFSIRRAQGDTSTFRIYGRAVGEPRKMDAYTVEFTTREPYPVMLDTVSLLFIVSKAWCEAHGAARSQDFAKGEESYASRNAMGTGPYMLTARDADIRSTFKRNPEWWGTFDGNVDEIVYTTIKSDATRMSALAAGDLDFVLDPPLQDIERLARDPKLHVYRAPENLTFMLGMNQSRAESPFRDLRVRRAVYQAIDTDLINRVVMRGLAVPIALPIPNPEGAAIDPALNVRLAYDAAASRRLLAEAGYPDGFAIELDCQNTREAVCTAVSGMLARVGVRVKVNSLQNARFFAKGQAREMAFYLIGWGGPNNDAIFTLQPLLHGRNDKRDGDYNWGDFRDEKMDALIDQAKVEMDGSKRKALIDEAMRIERDNIYYIPLHRRMAPWASRSNVEVVHRPDSWVEVRWVMVR